MYKIGRNAAKEILSTMGYHITRTFHFAMRNEHTPSAYINRNGTIYDFGTGWFGDIVDLIQEVHGLNFHDAVAQVEQQVTIFVEERNPNITTVDNPDEDYGIKTYAIDEQYIKMFENMRSKHSREFEKELKLLFTTEINGKPKRIVDSFDTALRLAKEYRIGYVSKSGRLIMPIYDIENKPMTFWKYKKNGSPNKISYSKNRPRPHLKTKNFVNTPSDIVVVTEGEKDFLATTGNGFNAFCVGSAGMSINDRYLHLFQGKTAIVCGDYDEAGQKFNKRIYNQLKNFAHDVKVMDWEKKARIMGFELFEKFDLSDYFAIKNMRKG